MKNEKEKRMGLSVNGWDKAKGKYVLKSGIKILRTKERKVRLAVTSREALFPKGTTA